MLPPSDRYNLGAMKGVLCNPQSFTITGASSSDCLMLYPGHLLRGRSYPFAEMQSVYFTTPADLVKINKGKYFN